MYKIKLEKKEWKRDMFQEEATEIGDLPDVEKKKERETMPRFRPG